MLKVLIIAESIARVTGGGRTGILGICESLSNQGVDVTLYTSILGEETFMELKSPIYINNKGYNIKYFPYSLEVLGTVLSFSFLSNLFKNIKCYDLVLIHSIYKINSTFAAFCCRFFSVPYVLRPHGSFDNYLIDRRLSFFKNLYIKIFEIKSIKFSESVQFSSSLELEQTVSKIGFIPKNIIISEGININNYILSSKYLNEINSDDYIKILFVGRFHKKKGIEILIEACKTLISKYNFKLLLVGGGDPIYEKFLYNKVKDLNLQKFITFVGYLNEEEKIKIIYSSDIFALASYGENFGLSLVEAMACNKPVVTTFKVGISNEISSANAGIITECDVLSFANGLESFLASKELRTFMGMNARKLATDKFSSSTMGKKLVTEYKAIIDNYLK